MTRLTRRQVVGSLGATAVATPLIGGRTLAQAGDIVVGSGQPLTGIFSFAGVAMDQGLNDYCAWRNENGGVQGRKLRYVAEDTGFKLDQSVAVFKKIMASEKPTFYYCDGTPTSKAVTQDVLAAGTVMTTSTSCASVLCDPTNMPHHFLASPTYGSMHEILMEYINRDVKGASGKPTVALVYSDTEFGRDGIPASKARAEKLGLQIVEEIITKQAGIDVTPEVARLRRAKPDVVIFQGYVLSPIPDFIKQMREAGMTSRAMGTIWSMDKPTYDALGAIGETWMGVMPYRYPYDTDSKMVTTIREYTAKNRPKMAQVSIFYLHAWLSGMIFAEIAERCIKNGKPLTLPNMKAALESIKDWDAGGLAGLPVDLSRHQIASGRTYRYNASAKNMEPLGDWIKV
jgi:branched-chain amino acid transport system substrate-binding protein